MMNDIHNKKNLPKLTWAFVATVRNIHLKLKPEERFIVVEGLIKSLDEPDSTIDAIWAEEAEKRLRAYRAGKLEGITMEEIFKEE